MAENVQELIIRYKADISDLQAKVTQIENNLRKADTSAAKTGKTIETGFAKAGESVKKTSGLIGDSSTELGRMENAVQRIGERVIAAFAVERVIHFGEEAVSAFAASQKAQLQLLNALKGQEDVQKRLINQADQLQGKFGIDNDVIVSQQAFLALQGRTEEQIQKTIKAAIELSAVTGEDFNSSIQKLDATFEGNIGRLGKLDKSFTTLTKSQLENGAAIDLVNQKYRGFAESGAASVSGQLEIQNREADDLSKKIGKDLAPSFVALRKAGLGLASAFFEISGGAADMGKNLALVLSGNTFGAEFKKLQDQFSEGLTTKSIQDLIQRSNELGAIQSTLSGKQRTAALAERSAILEEILLRSQANKKVQDQVETLETLKQKLEELKKQQETIADPTGAGKKQSDALIKEILAIQAKIDEITGDAEKKRIEARKEASKKLIDLEKKITEDLLKARGQNELQVLQAEKQNAENELNLTFSQSQKTIADKKNLNDALLKLTEEFGIKERELRLKNIQEAEKQNEEAAQSELSTIKTVFDSLKSDVDQQQVEATIKVNRDFVTTGDFSPQAEKDRQQAILNIQEDFDKKRIDAQKSFVTGFTSEEDKIIKSITDNANAQKNNVADSFFASGDFSDQAFIEANIKIQKIDADTNKLIQEHAKETASVKNDLSKEITQTESRESEARLSIAKEEGQKRLELENEIRDTIISGTEQIITESIQRRNDEEIKSIQNISELQLKSIDDEIAANDKARQDGALSRKTYEDKNKELIAQRVRAEDQAAAKIKAIKKSQFQADQIAAVSKIIIDNTINAAEFPALAEFYAILAAIQVGIVLARPNPYKAGTKSAKEGTALVGEAGPELVVMPGKSKVLTAAKTKSHASAVDAMIDGKFEEHVRKVYVEPALIEQAKKQTFKNVSSEEITSRITESVKNIYRTIQHEDNISFPHAFSIAKEAITPKSAVQKLRVPDYSFEMVPEKAKAPQTDETFTYKNLTTILTQLQVSHQLKEASIKHEERKQESFAKNIANSFMLTNQGLSMKDHRKINREGAPVTNAKEIAIRVGKEVAKEMEKVITDNKPSARRYS